MITLVNLIFPMVDSLVLSSNNPILLDYHSSELIHLGDVPGSFPVETSRSINQMAYLTA
jgi:hypothetical protein